MRLIGAAKLLLVLPPVAAVKTAVVYRGSTTCADCSESVGRLLKNSPHHFEIKYAGSGEAVALSPELLSQADLYTYPGGPAQFSEPPLNARTSLRLDFR
jgi:hypothetical protein